MSTENTLGAMMAAETSIRILLKIRNHMEMRGEARFYILRHISAIRLLRCVGG